MSSQSSSGQSNNNVIMFPKKNIRLVPPAEEDQAREIARRTYVDEVIDNYATSLLNKLAQQGFDVFDRRFDKHYGFTIEALRSTLLLTFDLDHPLQEVIDKTVRLIEEAEEAAANDDNYDPA
jgi:hypothetical protein